MPVFLQRPSSKLKTGHEDIQKISKQLVKYFDCIILKGSGNTELQDEYFRTTKSTLECLNRRHSAKIAEISMAVNVASCTIDWKDKVCFYNFEARLKIFLLRFYL